jgi:hypothetical protein
MADLYVIDRSRMLMCIDMCECVYCFLVGVNVRFFLGDEVSTTGLHTGGTEGYLGSHSDVDWWTVTALAGRTPKRIRNRITFIFG